MAYVAGSANPPRHCLTNGFWPGIVTKIIKNRQENRRSLPPLKAVFLFVRQCLAGLLTAAEGTISKVDLDNKKVTIKEGDKDNEYKFNDKVKVTVAGGKAKGGKGQAKEGTYADFEKALKVGEKLTFEAKDGVLTEVKITGMGKGKGKAND